MAASGDPFTRLRRRVGWRMSDGGDFSTGVLRRTPDFWRADKVEFPGWEAPYQEQDDGLETPVTGLRYQLCRYDRVTAP